MAAEKTSQKKPLSEESPFQVKSSQKIPIHKSFKLHDGLTLLYGPSGFAVKTVLTANRFLRKESGKLNAKGKKIIVWKTPLEVAQGAGKEALLLTGYTMLVLNEADPVSLTNKVIAPPVALSQLQSYVEENLELPPGPHLVVDGVPKGNVLDGVIEADLETRRTPERKHYYQHVDKIEGIVEALQSAKDISGGKPVAYLEIMGHGAPGTMQIGKDLLNDSTVSRLQARGLMAPGATIKLVSCQVGRDFTDEGSLFMAQLGHNLLDRGGHVVGSVMNVRPDGAAFEQAQKNRDRMLGAYDPIQKLSNATGEQFRQSEELLLNTIYNLLGQKTDSFIRDVSISPPSN